MCLLLEERKVISPPFTRPAAPKSWGKRDLCLGRKVVLMYIRMVVLLSFLK